MPGSGPPSRPSVVAAFVARAPQIVVVASAAFVFSGALRYFFSQDDFVPSKASPEVKEKFVKAVLRYVTALCSWLN